MSWTLVGLLAATLVGSSWYLARCRWPTTGGDGTDTVSYQFSATAVVADLDIDLGTGQGTDTLVNIENVKGSTLNNTINGDGGKTPSSKAARAPTTSAAAAART